MLLSILSVLTFQDRIDDLFGGWHPPVRRDAHAGTRAPRVIRGQISALMFRRAPRCRTEPVLDLIHHALLVLRSLR